MKAYTFNYKNDYAHGGIVILSESYEEAKKQIFLNKGELLKDEYDNVSLFVFENEDEFKKCLTTYIDKVLVFDKEVELNKAGIVYNYYDVC